MPTAKPLFRPDPSTSIFRAKWLHHFSKLALRLRTLQRTDGIHDTRSEAYASQVQFELLGMDYISIFSTEAQKLGLHESDFETEPLPFTARHVSSTLYVNPHTFVDDLKSRIEMTARIMGAKKQGRMPTTTRRRRLPLRTRQMVNEILWKREQAIQRGNWKLSPTAQEQVDLAVSTSMTLGDRNVSKKEKKEITATLLKNLVSAEASKESEEEQ